VLGNNAEDVAARKVVMSVMKYMMSWIRRRWGVSGDCSSYTKVRRGLVVTVEKREARSEEELGQKQRYWYWYDWTSQPHWHCSHCSGTRIDR
jgi:hypothetical protein